MSASGGVSDDGLDLFPDIDALHESASALTGLTDFGDVGYREALSLLIKGYNADPYMTRQGRLRCYQMAIGALVARLRS